MTTITRELIAAYLNGEVKTLTNSEQKELARIALASLEADSDSNNHPASGPLSDYRLHRIREILSKAAAQSDGGNLGYAMSDAVKAFDELLDARKAEPVAFINGAWTLVYYRPPKEAGLKIGDKLYTAPPAPVVPDIDTIALNTARNIMCDINRMEGWPGGDVQLLACIQSRIEQACRAAMLSGGKS